jgi:Rho-binding antiterminator
MSNYTPISCSAYDVLEAAAVAHTPLRLTFRTAEGTTVRDAYVIDLFSQEKVEYVKLQDLHTREELVLRLDALELIADMRTNAVYSPIACSPPSKTDKAL